MNRTLPVLLAPRALNLVALLFCLGAIGGALILQHWAGMEPCPLCIFQRIAVLAAAAVLVVAVLHNPGPTGHRVYAGLTILAAGTGAGIAIRHLWLQSLPPHQMPACGPGMDYIMDTFPFHEALAMVFAGRADCGIVETFLGISIPGWTLIVTGFLLMAAFYQLFRPLR